MVNRHLEQVGFLETLRNKYCMFFHSALHSYFINASDTITDNAFEVLMNSQRNQGDDVSQPTLKPATVSSLCWVCHQQGEEMPCAFCEHNACEMCVRQCDRCFGVFCTFCSTINYDNHEDRPLCLTCHNEDMRFQQKRDANAGAMQQPGAWQQGHTGGFRPLTA